MLSITKLSALGEPVRGFPMTYRPRNSPGMLVDGCVNAGHPQRHLCVAQTHRSGGYGRLSGYCKDSMVFNIFK